MGEGHLRRHRERRHLGHVFEPRADTRVDADERDRARPAHEVLDPHLVPGEAQEPRVGVDDLVDAANPATIGPLHGDPEPVALVDGVVPRHRLEVVLLADDVHAIANPGLALADPAALVLPVPLAVGLGLRRGCRGRGLGVGRDQCRWRRSSHLPCPSWQRRPSPVGGLQAFAQLRASPSTPHTCSSCGTRWGQRGHQGGPLVISSRTAGSPS